MSVFDKPGGSRRTDSRGARLISATLWHRTRRRGGDVLDSRRGSVRWVADDDEQAFDIVNADLPPTRVTFRLAAVTASLGASSPVPIEVGARGVRRSTWGVAAAVGGVDYRLQQRGRRLAELERGGQTIAVLARPRRGLRTVNWSMAVVTDEEIALGHALAACAEIGSPGAVAGIVSILPV